MLTRGSGGRGYSPGPCVSSTRILIGYPWPDYPKTYWTEGITVTISDIYLSENTCLSGIKHLNRLEQVMAASRLGNFDEALMCDKSHNVIEGTRTNLFALIDNKLCTPSLDQVGIKGVMRSFILSLCKQKNIDVKERAISQKELMQAAEIFVCNSVLGIWPVKQVLSTHFSIGVQTTRLANLIKERIMC